ncbi:MAG: flap endonuclease-1 [Methanomassiliicoccales archaeon]|nr:flap endonuclease-1 [Methanomassiliicoccales archaeon]
MGVNLSDVVPAQSIDLEQLSGLTLAVDAYNAIYQFLSVIRQPDGTPLRDQRGRVTSHLAGLLYRNANFLEAGMLPAYVFDGIPSKLKQRTIEERGQRRAKAKREWEDAVEKGDYQTAYSKATQASRVTNEIVESSRLLLTHLGIPVVQAPAEGEAQAAFMAKKGDVWAASSQDFDSLLFGAPRLVRNLTLAQKRALPSGKTKEISIEVIELEPTLSSMGITREQLVDLCILMGTDYNEGVLGIGPKKGLKLIKERKNLEGVMTFLQIEIENHDEIRDLFLRFEGAAEYKLEWRAPDEAKVIDLLCGQYDFSRQRVEGALKRMVSLPTGRRRIAEAGQSSLDTF